MLVKELIDALSKWPSDASVELSVPTKHIEREWFDTRDVEEPTGADDDLCLIIAGEVVMG